MDQSGDARKSLDGGSTASSSKEPLTAVISYHAGNNKRGASSIATMERVPREAMQLLWMLCKASSDWTVVFNCLLVLENSGEQWQKKAESGQEEEPTPSRPPKPHNHHSKHNKHKHHSKHNKHNKHNKHTRNHHHPMDLLVVPEDSPRFGWWCRWCNT